MSYTFDAAYVRRLAEGDPLIETHFVEYFGGLLRLKIRRKVRFSDEAEDIRQETFARVFATIRQGSGLRDPAALGSFVNSVCENVIREFIRKKGRIVPMPDAAPEPVDPGQSPDSELDRPVLVKLVEEVLADLSERDRVVLRELFLEEHDRSEICFRHGVRREYLRVLVHRARERFRKRYQDICARKVRSDRRAGAFGHARPAVGD